MFNTFFWILVVFSGALVIAGLTFRNWQREAGLMMAFLGLVLGLFTLGFVAGQFV